MLSNSYSDVFAIGITMLEMIDGVSPLADIPIAQVTISSK